MMGGARFPWVMHNENILGGRACLFGTRVPVWTVITAIRAGMSHAKILEEYTSLDEKLIREAVKYADENPEEIEQDIQEQEESEADDDE